MKQLFSCFLLFLGFTSYSQYGHITPHLVQLHYIGNVVGMLNPTDSLDVWGMAYDPVYNDTDTAHQRNDMEVIRSADGGRSWLSYAIPGTSLKDSAYIANLWP